MHQFKTIAQTLFVLSVLNFVFAAPAVPREAHDTRNNVVAEDVSERRRAASVSPGGTTLGQYLSSTLPDGSPRPDLSEMDDVPCAIRQWRHRRLHTFCQRRTGQHLANIYRRRCRTDHLGPICRIRGHRRFRPLRRRRTGQCLGPVRHRRDQQPSQPSLIPR
jgi:hypothetical protein